MWFTKAPGPGKKTVPSKNGDKRPAAKKMGAIGYATVCPSCGGRGVVNGKPCPACKGRPAGSGPAGGGK